MGIKGDQHVFIAGQTGSGKTYLSKMYLAGNEKPVFVLDAKGTFNWEQVPKKQQVMITHLTQLPDAARNFKYVIYRPSADELEEEYYDEFYNFCYSLKNCTVYTDEIMQICPNPFKMPQGLKSILTRGRELNVNSWNATQRPANIPVLVYSECTHWFIFTLRSPSDRKKLIDLSSFDEFDTIMPQYMFQYFDGLNNPIQATLTKDGRVKLG